MSIEGYVNQGTMFLEVHSERSPLFYPGGKAKALPHIMKYVPEGITEACSPFIGGGSVELALAAKGIRVHAADAFEPVVNFWQQLLKAPKTLVTKVGGYLPQSNDGFLACRRRIGASRTIWSVQRLIWR